MEKSKKKKLNYNNSTKPKKTAKKPYDYLDYYDVFSFKRKPVSQLFIEKLAKKFIEWSQKPKNLTFRGFLLEIGMCNDDFDRLLSRSLALQHAKKHAFAQFADKREKNALYKKFETSFANRGMIFYDKDWQRVLEKENKFRQKEDTQHDTKIVVEIPRMPETDIVPKKKKNEARNKNKIK